MILLVFLLEILFSLNILFYWIIFLKSKDKIVNTRKFCEKFFPIFWSITLIPIPIINSSLFKFFFTENVSFFQQYWLWFLLLGLIFVIIGIILASKAMKSYKVRAMNIKESELITKGPYSIIRHPIYSAWALIFLGVNFIFDSFLALIFTPFLYLLLEAHSILEEKHVLIPIYGSDYKNYMKKVPYRLLSQPYNYLIIILTVIIIYIGILNFAVPS